MSHFPPRLDLIDIDPWKGYVTVGAVLGAILALLLWLFL